jgi:glycosyltransferase involved in cell wall biosynthesis
LRVIIVETNARGGLAQFAYHMASALAETGVDVTLLTGTEYELGHLPHNFTTLPELRLWTLFNGHIPKRGLQRLLQISPARRLIRGFKFVRAWLQIVSRIRKYKPDAVIVSMIHFPFEFFFLRQLRSSGVTLIQVCHEIEQRDFKRGWWARRVGDPLLLRAYKCFSLIVFLASSVERDFTALYGDVSRRILLPHGPPLFLEGPDEDLGEVRARYAIGSNERVVLFFGLLRPSKGVEDLVEAFAALRNRGGVRLLIAGHPTKAFDTGNLLRRVKHLGIEESVSLHIGYVPDTDVRPLLRMAEMLVLPYRSATASGPAAAAQFLCCPIVATDVGGFRDIIQDGITGRLVPKEDRIALCDAIAEMLDNPDQARSMAKAAKVDQTENRSWARFAREMVSFITNNQTNRHQ